MKRIILSLFLAVSALALTAQTHLRNAIVQMATQSKYINSVVSQSSNPNDAQHSYYSFYSYAFKMPRKVGQKQINAILEAYNADLTQPDVTMRALHMGVDDNNEQYVVGYGDGRKVTLGREFDNLALVRTPSNRGEGYRNIAAIEWEEEDRRIVGRAYIIEGQHPDLHKKLSPTPSNNEWGTYFQDFKDKFEGLEGLSQNFDTEEFEKMAEQLKNMDAKHIVVTHKDGHPMITIIENGDTITKMLTPSDSFNVGNKVRVTAGGSKDIANYLHRFDFYDKAFKGKNNAYNKQLLREFIEEGRKLLPNMSLRELEETIEEAGELMEEIEEGDRDAKMIQDLGTFIGECGVKIGKLSFTEASKATQEAREAVREANKEFRKARKAIKKRLR